MSPRQRFLTALHCGIPDRVPVSEYLFSRRLQKEILGYTTELYDGESQIRMAEKLGLDAVWIPANGFCGLEESAHAVNESYIDEWGVGYIKNGWPIMVQREVPVKSKEDWSHYEMPRPDAPYRTKMIRDAMRANERDIGINAGFLGPFTMMYWYLMDLETLSFMIYDDPTLIHEMCRAYTRWVLECAQLVLQCGRIDSFNISDDWGGTDSLLFSPQDLRTFFIPPFRAMVQGLKSSGVPVIMHNDGRISDVLDDLVNTGISGYHPVERAAGMDLAAVKERYRGRICPIGNVNNKTTLVNGTAGDVERETAECLRLAAPGGGYILASDHSFHDDIPSANIFALIETAKRFGKYPLKF